MKNFWLGFYKKADATSGLTGGTGFTGTGKGSISGQLERDQYEGTESSFGVGDGNDTRTDKGLLDRERGPRSFEIGDQGPEFQAESNPHIKY